jgi:hypothetical protein
MQRSECCDAPVRIEYDHIKGTSVPMYYVCVTCNQPADVIEEEDKYAEKTPQEGN